MKVLLVNPPDELESMLGVGREFIQSYEPLGILYIAAVLREQGHDVHIVDAHAEGLDPREIRERIETLSPQVLGFSTLTCNGAIVFELGRWAKEKNPGIFVVLGNIHASVFARQYLENGCCDVVVHGEGEWTMMELLSRLSRDAPWDDIAGLTFLDGAGSLIRIPMKIECDLSSLPMPARDLVDQSLYGLRNFSNQLFVQGKTGKAKTMVTSRGCPHRCTFCVVHGSRKPRYNSASRVVDEMETLQNNFDASYVFVDDPLFLADRQRVLDICDEYRHRRLTIQWGGTAHVRSIDKELVTALDSANCFDLGIGIESGVQRLLDETRKRISLEQVRQAVHTVKRHSRIQLEGLFILGLPGETKDDAIETIRFACTLPLDMAQFSVFTPYPGSPVFDELVAKDEIDTGIREESRVDTSVWKRFSQYICFTDLDPIWVTPTMTSDTLRRLQKRAHRRFYLRPGQVLRHIRRIRPNNFMTALRILSRGFF